MKISKFSSIILSICELVVGILLLVNPVAFTRGIIIFVGIVLLILGLISVVLYFREEAGIAAVKQDLTKGCIGILAGIFCIFKSSWFISTFPLLTILYGIVILITGIAKFQWTVDKIRLKIKRWVWSAVSAVLTVTCAIIILCNPFESTTFLWTFIAVILIIEAVIDIIAFILTREIQKEVI